MAKGAVLKRRVSELMAASSEALARLKQWGGETQDRVIPLLAPSETKFLAATAVLIGLAAGLVTFGFDWLIDLIFKFGLGAHEGLESLPLMGRWRAVLWPTLGGLAVGHLIHRFAPEAKGEGVPAVIEAVRRRGGRLPARAAVSKALLSAITIGTGGSAGREGPVVLIGASLGSALGRLVRLPATTLRIVAAAGSAAGIAAAFNAPLGGMAFAVEVILGEFSAGPFAMVLLSTVVAATVSRTLHGHEVLIPVPAHRMNHPSELVLYLVLGAAAGVLSKLFARVFVLMHEEFERHRLPPQWRPALGGLLMGMLAMFLPRVLGAGYGPVGEALRGDLSAWRLVSLLFGKMLATSLTLGSGGSGGTLMPAVFMGAMTGSLLGKAADTVFPGAVAPSAYATVGMGAFLAGMIHAPLTAILIVFEATSDYSVILPLMLAVGAAVLTARVVEPDSLYVLGLRRRGVDLSETVDPSMQVAVSSLMTRNVETLAPDFPVGKLGRLFNKKRLTGFPVVDPAGALLGMVTLTETQTAYGDEAAPPPDLQVSRIMRAPGRPLFPDDAIAEAARRMSSEDIDRLPVVDRADPRRLVGIISRSDLLRAYADRT